MAMMTPEERDALIDVTVEACAKAAEKFYENDHTLTRAATENIGALIAIHIRKEFAKSHRS
jgi:hypothetical protein